MNYYNDNDPYVAQWLRNLVDAGLLPPGDVDERSITEVTADDVRGYEQCHWFAGIGGWVLALEWAGWRGPVWTGSCPCQPLSSAGQRKGHADERHLWPAFQRLIAECRPVVCFGEQVSSKLGREWMSAVSADLVAAGYAVGAADIPAAGLGAPHIRQRLYWVADSGEPTSQWDSRGFPAAEEGICSQGQPNGNSSVGSANGCEDSRSASRGLADTGRDRLCDQQSRNGSQTSGQENVGGQTVHVGRRSTFGGLGNAVSQGLERCPGDGNRGVQPGRIDVQTYGPVAEAGTWIDVEWLPCADGKARPTQPGLHPLAARVPGDVAKLRALGNAVVPEVAAAFIQAYMATQGGTL